MKIQGFTLIELMIVVAVLAVLAAIAIPIYSDHVDRTRRADAVTGLTQLAQALERCFTRNNSYTADACPSGPVDSPDGFYTITINPHTATTYTLRASPDGIQQRDDCTEFTLDHLGNRGASPSVGECWATN